MVFKDIGRTLVVSTLGGFAGWLLALAVQVFIVAWRRDTAAREDAEAGAATLGNVAGAAAGTAGVES